MILQVKLALIAPILAISGRLAGIKLCSNANLRELSTG